MYSNCYLIIARQRSSDGNDFSQVCLSFCHSVCPQGGSPCNHYRDLFKLVNLSPHRRLTLLLALIPSPYMDSPYVFKLLHYATHTQRWAARQIACELQTWLKFIQRFEELAKRSQNMSCGQCDVSKCLAYRHILKSIVKKLEEKNQKFSVSKFYLSLSVHKQSAVLLLSDTVGKRAVGIQLRSFLILWLFKFTVIISSNYVIHAS